MPSSLSLCIAISLAVCGTANIALADKPKRRLAELNVILDDLESPRFAVRESATRKLQSAGQAAIPAMKSAVMDGGMESISRCLGILHQFHLGSEPKRSQAAFQAISETRSLSAQTISPRTVDTIRQIHAKWERDAQSILRKRGASPFQGHWTQITIDNTWSGEDSDLKHFYYLPQLSKLNISKSPIADNGLAILSRLPNVHTIRIRIQGSGLVHLRNMPSLRFLSLKNSRLDANSLVGLAGCDRLQSLGLDDTNVNDTDLANLPVLPELQDVWLNRTRITDDALLHLQRMPKIRKLILTGLSTKGPGLAHLAAMPHLDYLSLKHSTCDDACMVYIERLTQVTSLGLDDTKVTDAGMRHIEPLAAHLSTLWLTNTEVSDQSITHLKKLVNAKRMYLSGTNISQPGLAELRAALPGCTISKAPSKKK